MQSMKYGSASFIGVVYNVRNDRNLVPKLNCSCGLDFRVEAEVGLNGHVTK